MKPLKELFHLPIFPIIVIVCLVINCLIIRNTSEAYLYSLSPDDYLQKASKIYREEFYVKYERVLDVLSVFGWVLLFCAILK